MVAYVDSSVVTAIAFREPGWADLSARLRRFRQLSSAPLLEAEVRAAARREGAPVDEGWLEAVTWVMPETPLGPEIIRVLEHGYVRGADCWHLATALRLMDDIGPMTFLTLDLRQQEFATALGFAT